MISKLYEGMVALVDTETGERMCASVLIAMAEGSLTYTLIPVGADHPPVTLHGDLSGDARMIVDVIRELRRVCVTV